MDKNKIWTIRNIGDALSATKAEDSMRLIGLSLQLSSLVNEIAVGPVVDKVRAYDLTMGGGIHTGNVVRFSDSKGHEHHALVTRVGGTGDSDERPTLGLAYFDSQSPDGGDIVNVTGIRHQSVANEHEAWWRLV